MTSQQTGGLKPTRRTLVKGAAWSVPVVAVASQAPAMAASPVIVFNLAESCKDSSGQGANTYYFVFNTSLPVGTSVTVTSWVWVPNASDHDFVAFTPVTATVTDAGRLVYAFTDDGSSATNGSLTVCFSWSGPDVVSDSDCVNTGNNNYSSCGGSTPTTTPGTGAEFPPTKVWPVPEGQSQTQSAPTDANEEELEPTTVEEPVVQTEGTRDAGTTDAGIDTTEAGTTDAGTGTTEGGTTENG